MMTHTLRTTLLVSAAAASLAAPGFAFAQQGVNVDEIVVTGSRIRRDTFSAPVPLSVISGEAIRESGQTSLGEILMDLPAIAANTNGQNTNSSLFLAGQARADIRGLGATRTLVLMDGRRHVFSDASSPAVDLNLIPQIMIDRVDVVPGGGSAVYGSEAIAGVVNIIMRKQLDGFEATLQGGATGENDGEEFSASAIWGRKLAGDRLSVLLGGEVSRVEPILQRDRGELYPGIRRNTLATVQNVIPNSRTNITYLGTFQLRTGALGAAQAVTFDPSNPSSVVRLSPECSTTTVQPTCQDGVLPYSTVFTGLQGRTERKIIRGYAEYDITDKVKAFVDASFAHVDGYGFTSPSFTTAAAATPLPMFISGDNAFLNGNTTAAANLRAAFTAAGLTLAPTTRVAVARYFADEGTRDTDSRRSQLRLVGGMNGEFEAADRTVNWDWYAQYGELTGRTLATNIVNIAKTTAAVDAITVGGQIVCRDVAMRNAGCVPFDLVNGPSRAALQYINGFSTTDTKVKQTVVAGNVNVDLFTLPAGPVGLAVGGEYRKEESFFAQDPLGATPGALFYNNIGTRAGSYNIKEAYAEVRVPLLKEVPFAYELTVEAAGRLSDYSSIGNTHQYRIAGNWAPVKDLMIRASQGTAVRAPNIVELYAPQSQNFTATGVDPCDRASFAGATAAQQAARRVTCAAAIPGYNPATFVSNIGSGRPSLELLSGGNPNLGPEKAKTWSLGGVIKPRWTPGLQLSFDWFKYDITDQVGTIPLATLFQNLCYDATQAYASNPFCALITRDTAGTRTGIVGGVSVVSQTQQNVAREKVEGYDASIAYRFATEDLLGRDYGSVAAQVDVTRMYNWALQGLPGQAYTQLANTITNATPEWKGQATVQWTMDRWQVQGTAHYIGSMVSTISFTPAQLDPFYTGDFYLYDMRVKYRVSDQLSLRGGVLNLTNEYPPYLPETYQGTSGGASNFENRGRFFYMAASLKY